MPPNPIASPVPTLRSPRVLHRLLGGLSIFTMLMTIPQVLTIWVGHRAAGVSHIPAGAYRQLVPHANIARHPMPSDPEISL
jgi:hypothetical protein